MTLLPMYPVSYLFIWSMLLNVNIDVFIISYWYFFLDAVLRFQEINKFLPPKIIIFRDGVGESNIRYVIEHEVMTIKVSFRTKNMNKIFLKIKFSLFCFSYTNQKYNTCVEKKDGISQFSKQGHAHSSHTRVRIHSLTKTSKFL